MACDIGEPYHGSAEREHGDEVGVVPVGYAEHMRRDGQGTGDVAQGASIGDAAAATLDHGNVAPVVPEQVCQLLLGHRAGLPVPAQDCSQLIGLACQR
jgi:hypothetical protein